MQGGLCGLRAPAKPVWLSRQSALRHGFVGMMARMSDDGG
jgi:hypothetical protein